MNNEEIAPKRESITESLKKYKIQHGLDDNVAIQNPIANTGNPIVTPNSLPKPTSFNQVSFEKNMSKETDPDLMTSYEIVPLPSKGLFYKNGLSEVNVEYMTSKDEDLLTTASLIENGTVIDVLLKRKIKTPNVNVEELLEGDRSAIILFLRTSSYGVDYNVTVTDPRNNTEFKSVVDLSKLQYKELTELPDENGYFTVDIPMRKKTVLFRLLNIGENKLLEKKAKAIQEAYNEEFSQYSTLKLKSHIVSIDENTDRTYIDKFVDAMPALDAYTIRKKIQQVSPDIDMKYQFITKDNFSFDANLSLGLDFFFPSV
jgi:hypothetical protein